MFVETEACFPNCPCSCGGIGEKFDRISLQELRVPIKLNEICRQNIGWYCDRSIETSGVSGWRLRDRSGLYFLWHKENYCDQHHLYHMRALYVGKGAFAARLRTHWASKNTAEQQLIYFSYVELPNRIAKYVEQLLLDIYRLPLNRSENRGTDSLCAYFTQSEVD